MDMLKLDAALAALMSRAKVLPGESVIDVSVGTRAPLTSEEGAELTMMRIESAKPQCTVFPARISLDTLHALASKPWVMRISLAQELRPLVVDREH